MHDVTADGIKPGPAKVAVVDILVYYIIGLNRKKPQIFGPG